MAEILVAYDVVNDKRRNKMAKYLEQFGTRLNKSVFICQGKLATVKQVKEGLEPFTKKGDVIIIFQLCNKCYENGVILGAPPLTKRQAATLLIE